MKHKALRSLIMIVSLLTVSIYSMDQALISVTTLDTLPSHPLNIIGASLKRPGRDRLKCVNKALNENIFSQDELRTQLITAEQNNNPHRISLLKQYNAFACIEHELISAIKDNNFSLAQWGTTKTNRLQGPFMWDCIRSASEIGDLSMIRMLFGKSNDERKTFLAETIILAAAKHGYLPVIKSFTTGKYYYIDWSTALYYAKENKHQDIVDILTLWIRR